MCSWVPDSARKTPLLSAIQPSREKPVAVTRQNWLLLAESHLTRRLFGAMARRIAAFPVPGGQPEAVGAIQSVDEEVRDGKLSLQRNGIAALPGFGFVP